eukprot:TRINITY_DN35952_c0_g1_i1.p1 TRINITY_DN35952_c0_g1~~TRINITY_DN35952_c0_g1_i1.p1  ORF type:complete len:197 (+),score=50.55 TRINITY_DN35952_c0_g1_i1:82-591(+)
MPGIDYSKWDKIADSDDEEASPPAAPPPPPPPAPAPAPAAPTGEDCADLSGAPHLKSPDAIGFYSGRMTLPQRMLTLVHFWNASERDQRVGFLRRLIDVIGDVRITNQIRGGQEVLRDLDPAYYSGVSYPEHWRAQFTDEGVESRCSLFERFYQTLSPDEQRLVLGTLM